VTADWARVLDGLERCGRVARVVVAATRGSTPREAGAAMVVRPDLGFHGTIGGGALEWRALDAAAAALAAPGTGVGFLDVSLGPDLGQCCGGRVTLAVEVLDATALAEVRDLAIREREGPFFTELATAGSTPTRRIRRDAPVAVGLSADGRLIERFGDDRRPLLLFGAGHLGRALVLALAPLPFRVDWIDERDAAFPAAQPGNVTPRSLDDPVRAVVRAPAGAFVLALTHDHALDLALVDAALRRPEIAWIGCVGSKSKRARFSSKFREMGHTDGAIRRMVMPVGALGLRSKAPSAIAAAVAVELLVADESARAEGAARGADVWTSEVAV